MLAGEIVLRALLAIPAILYSWFLIKTFKKR